MNINKKIAEQEIQINQLENIIRVMNLYGESAERKKSYEQKLIEHKNYFSRLLEEKNLKEG
ncbi:hypothetical protein COJ01_17445 [Priestia megaterium]|uniref:hypothetical protein n=1 Tax=Priestia megaterium TaxID=1404 RepID=UPI000BF9ED79|nr:hypothetical protein [Priestia megaterium]PFK99852.1 hypothetical protein COJ01_17445 [Priestia megaterium]